MYVVVLGRIVEAKEPVDSVEYASVQKSVKKYAAIIAYQNNYCRTMFSNRGPSITIQQCKCAENLELFTIITIVIIIIRLYCSGHQPFSVRSRIVKFSNILGAAMDLGAQKY